MLALDFAAEICVVRLHCSTFCQINDNKEKESMRICACASEGLVLKKNRSGLQLAFCFKAMLSS